MPAQDSVDISHLERQLSEAATHAEQGNYEAAVKAVRAAKSLAPRNVYVLAFERQAEQLHELHSSQALTEEQRTDILESIPAIIERALEFTRSPGTATDVSALKAGDASLEKKEKAAALEWLKNQYFQHAHEYIRKGEYDHALAEIRRVFIIDPENGIARDFEKQFEALAQLKRRDNARASAQAPPTIAITPAGEPPSPQEPEATPMMTEEWSSPQQIARQTPRAVRAPEKPAAKPRGNTLLVTLIVVALCVLGALLYYYYQRNIYKKPQVTSLPPAAAEQFIGAPAEVAEQNFLVTQDDSSTGTPEVTDVTVRDEPPAESAHPPGRKTPEVASRTKTKNSSPAAQAPQRPVGQPPVMATQPQPAQKEAPSPAKSEDTATPVPFIPVEKQARIIRLEKPKISLERFAGGVTGQVVVQVRIDATGKPVQIVTLKSTNDLLIQPVIDAIMSSQFAPAEMTTGPVASWLTIPFRFASQ